MLKGLYPALMAHQSVKASWLVNTLAAQKVRIRIALPFLSVKHTKYQSQETI